jgi:DNA-binding CsgD family transcriptional regulator
VDQITTQEPVLHHAQAELDLPHHGSCLTLDVTSFLLGRVSMDEVCQYCVLTALAPLHPWQMSIYIVGGDSLFRLAGSFGKGEGLDALHEYSCLDEPHVGEELHHGRPLATFPLVGMRPEQHLNIPDLHDGPQVLWPLKTAHRLIGVMHVRFTMRPDAHATTDALAAIAGPITLTLDLSSGPDPFTTAAGPNGHSSSQPSTMLHPSMLGPLSAESHQSRPLSVVRWGETAHPAAATTPSAKDLTSRQLRVLGLMAKGMTNGQIARVLAFSESTIRQETMAIYRTLQVKGRAEAVDFGRSNGLIPSSA